MTDPPRVPPRSARAPFPLSAVPRRSAAAPLFAPFASHLTPPPNPPNRGPTDRSNRSDGCAGTCQNHPDHTPTSPPLEARASRPTTDSRPRHHQLHREREQPPPPNNPNPPPAKRPSIRSHSTPAPT